MALKTTSSPIAISFRVEESAANTFTQERIDLQLNPLDNEVFLVYAIDLAPSPPDDVAAGSAVLASVSTTSQTGITGLENSNVLVRAERAIVSDGAVAVSFEHMAGETPQADLDYIGIIASNDFFVQIQGQGNTAVRACAGRMWGARAKADSSTYAALVQSEVLSS